MKNGILRMSLYINEVGKISSFVYMQSITTLVLPMNFLYFCSLLGLFFSVWIGYLSNPWHKFYAKKIINWTFRFILSK